MNLLWVLALCQMANGQLFTNYVVSTQMSTYTRTILTSTICVKLKENPMPVCRRRNAPLWTMEDSNYWEPDQQFLIQPTDTLQVEPTAVPWFKIDQHSGFADYSPFNLPPPNVIQPSLFMPAALRDFQWRNSFERMDYGANSYSIDSPRPRRSNFMTVITVIYTKPTTEIEMTTKTNTIVVSGCTPVPFPYDVCE